VKPGGTGWSAGWMHRLQHRDAAARIHRRRGQRALEGLDVDRLRARGRGQDGALARAAHGHGVELAVALQRRVERALGWGELGRIHDQHVEGARGGGLQPSEDVGLHQVQAIRHAGPAGVLARALDRAGRHVDGGRSAGALRERLQREPAEVGVAVEHIGARAQRAHAAVVLALIQERARLLAVLRVDGQRHAVLEEAHLLDLVAAHDARGGREALARAHAAGGHGVDGAGREQGDERVEDHVLQALHAQRRDLHRDDVTVDVDVQAGEAVALGVHQPIRGGGGGRQAEPGAQGLGGGQALREERRVDGHRVARQHTHGDLRLRVVEAAPDKAPLVVDHVDHVAGLDLAADLVDGLRVQPWVAEPQRLGASALDLHARHLDS
jgi:hypothetical protein